MPLVAAAAGFVTAAIGTGALVFDFAGGAFKHEAMVEKIKALRADLARCDKSPSAIRDIEARLNGLGNVEPGHFAAVNARAWNTAYLGLSKKPDRRALLILRPWEGACRRSCASRPSASARSKRSKTGHAMARVSVDDSALRGALIVAGTPESVQAPQTRDPGVRMAAQDVYEAAAALVIDKRAGAVVTDTRRWRLLKQADWRLRGRLASKPSPANS